MLSTVHLVLGGLDVFVLTGATAFAGSSVGQAAVFDSFQLEDGTEGKCTGIDPVATAMEAARAKLPPSQENIDVSRRGFLQQLVL